MNVALVTSRLSLRGGGIAAAVVAFARTLAATGAVCPSLIAFDAPGGDGRRDRGDHGDSGPGDGGDDGADDGIDGIDVTVLPAFGPAAFKIAPGLGRTLAASGCDIVHTHGLWTWASAAAAAWARRPGRVLVVSPHGMLDGWALARSAARKRVALALFERQHLSRAAVIHALTAAEAAAIRAAGCAAPIAVVPNGIDLPALAPARRQHHAAGTDPRRVLLFLGRLHPKKGVEALIGGWAKAVARDPALAAGWRLEITGWDDGGHLAGYRAAAGRTGAAASITVTGPVHGAAKAAAYARAGAFILPSVSEGLPMTILEAWSHGLPVFATAACNIPDGFAADAAIVIERDPDAIATTLVAALSDPRRLAATAAAGRRLAAERYAWAPIAARWRAIYAWAAGRAPPPPDILPALGRAPPPPDILPGLAAAPVPADAVPAPGRAA